MRRPSLYVAKQGPRQRIAGLLGGLRERCGCADYWCGRLDIFLDYLVANAANGAILTVLVGA
jgi:hypothetical protein